MANSAEMRWYNVVVCSSCSARHPVVLEAPAAPEGKSAFALTCPRTGHAVEVAAASWDVITFADDADLVAARLSWPISSG